MSVWIDYFNGENSSLFILDELIDSDRIAINQLILSYREYMTSNKL
jgi:hypothetical protein